MGYVRNSNLPDMVEKAMEHNRFTRDDDYLLLGVVCDMNFPAFEHPIRTYTELVQLLTKLPRIPDIARARRKVWKKHNYTKYLPTTPWIAEQRKISPKVYEEFKKLNPDRDTRELDSLGKRMEKMREEDERHMYDE